MIDGLFTRAVGAGPTIIVLHGGPDFDHRYLLPDMNRLADSFRLIYYDQRGRGRSADGVVPEDVTIESEIEDIESVRRHFGIESVAVLGHSWGALLAMEYAVRHPDRVSHLVLINMAPASADDWQTFRSELLERRTAEERARMDELSSSERFRRGDLEVEAEYYRLHFRPVLRPERLDAVVRRLRSEATTCDDVLRARAIEQRLYEQTWMQPGYDLVPKLREVDARTLVLHGEHDFVSIAAASRVAGAVPDARFAVMRAGGHFAFLEAPDDVHANVSALFGARH